MDTFLADMVRRKICINMDISSPSLGLSMCFFCPFSILITLLGEEGAGLCACAFVC